MPGKDGWLSQHLRQDGTLVATMIAFGLSSLVIIAAATVHVDLENDSMFALAVVGVPIAGLPGPIALIVRLVRGGRGKPARCEVCGARPAAEVRYLQVTGVVVIAILREARLAACARCSGEAYVGTTAHTALLGWWSLLTPLVIPWVVLANTLAWLKGRLTLGGSRGAAGALEIERDYARNLLRSKDPETVVEVLARKTGVPPEQVAAWLATFPEAGAKRPDGG
jgi:hypothetical protein